MVTNMMVVMMIGSAIRETNADAWSIAAVKAVVVSTVAAISAVAAVVRPVVMVMMVAKLRLNCDAQQCRN